MYKDATGEFIVSTVALVIIAGAAVLGTAGGIYGNCRANNTGATGWKKAEYIVAWGTAGAVVGGIAGYFVAPAVVGATGVAGVSVASAGITTIAAVGTSFGKLGTLIINNGQQIINWFRTTYHAYQRMLERGVTEGMVETWVRTGKALQQSGDKILFITKQGAAVVNKAGQVITAYSSQYFDSNMWEVVEKLFGK